MWHFIKIAKYFAVEELADGSFSSTLQKLYILTWIDNFTKSIQNEVHHDDEVNAANERV